MLYLRLGVAIALILGCLWLRSHFIEVGRDQVRNEVKLASDAEAQRQGDAKSAALEDALARVATLSKLNATLQNELNSSEVLNHAEADTACLSDSRRMRINAAGR